MLNYEDERAEDGQNPPYGKTDDKSKDSGLPRTFGFLCNIVF